MDMDVKIIRSDRRTIAIQVNPDLTVTVRAPRRVPMREIERILQEKQSWIQKHIEQMKKKQACYDGMERTPLTSSRIQELRNQAMEYIPKRVAYFADIMGVDEQ